MPFFRRVGDSSTAKAGSTSSAIKDNVLTQPDNTWSNAWLYDVTTGESSLIRSFTASDDILRLENTFADDITGDEYEILSVWTPTEVHDALNDAIRVARRSFPDTVTDTSIVVKDSTLTYSLSSLNTAPWIINKIWVEQRSSCVRGDVRSATLSSITVPYQDGLNSSWVLTIFDGTGAGQQRNVVSASTVGSNSVIVVADWVITPDATSKYTLFDATDEKFAWKPFNDFHQDTEEFPNVLYFNKLYTSHYGMRLRIEYLWLSDELIEDDDITNIPLEYLKAKSCSILHGQALSNTKADRDFHYAEYKRYSDEADSYLIRNAIHTSGVRFRTPVYGETNYMTNDDPLNWGAR